jgi:hypothetical protein
LLELPTIGPGNYRHPRPILNCTVFRTVRDRMNELALFAGAGGGLLGSSLLGWTTVGAVEIEKYPRDVLLQRQRDGLLDDFPVWDDVCTFDGKPWRGAVDVLSGGFPCQDISAAGSTSVRITDGTECGYLDTPTAMAKSGQWPTPKASDGEKGTRTTEGAVKALQKGRKDLGACVKVWPTPTASDWRGGTGKTQAERGRKNGPSLAEANRGSLNPTWVEWLMGWPLGWTDLKPLGTDKFRQWQQQHSGFLAEGFEL